MQPPPACPAAAAPAAAVPAVAALIQLRGAPLAGGRVEGKATLPLERAAGGDTPVLSFSSDRGRLRLLVDTGASSTLIEPAAAARLGLASRPVPPESFGLAGAGSDCETLRPGRTTLPQLRLAAGAAGLRIVGAEALVLPVGGLPPGIDGVLGAPTLRRLPLWIDPPGGRISLGAAALSDAARAGAASPVRSLMLPLRWQSGVPLLPLSTPFGTVQALADTGAEGLFLTAGLAARLPAQGPPRPLRLTGFCGEQSASRLRLSGLALPGGDRQAPLEAIVTRNPIFAALGVEAIVGQELLRRRAQLWRLDTTPPRLTLW